MKQFNTRLLAEYWIERTAHGPVSVLVGYTYGVAGITFTPFGTLGWKAEVVK